MIELNEPIIQVFCYHLPPGQSHPLYVIAGLPLHSEVIKQVMRALPGFHQQRGENEAVDLRVRQSWDSSLGVSHSCLHGECATPYWSYLYAPGTQSGSS